MLVQLTPLQARIIGVLLEKEITTPDQYPLSLNALTLGCNQKSSREPIMQLSDTEVQTGLDELRSKNLLLEYRSGNSRVVKYKHRFCNTEFGTLQFSTQQLSLVCILLLRGPQTAGELRTRTHRLAAFCDVTEVESVLTQLLDLDSEKVLIKLDREAGKRDCRYAHLFCGRHETKPFSAVQLSDDTRGDVVVPITHSNELEHALAKIGMLEEKVKLMSQQLEDMEKTLRSLSR